MVYTYTELLKIGYSKYEIKQALKNNYLFKTKFNLYSTEKQVNTLELITKRYPRAIFNSYSALFYHHLTDTIPESYFVSLLNNERKIFDKDIITKLEDDKLYGIGLTKTKVNNVDIRIYDKERILIDIIKNKKNMPFDQYKEVINNYRKIVNELDFNKIEKYAAINKKNKNILSTILMEVK